MAEIREHYVIEKLQGRENYASWKFAMRALLEGEDLWGCVQGTKEHVADAKKMAKTKSKIVLAVDKRNYSHIRAALTPKQMWQDLQKAFEDKGLTRRVTLLRTLTSIKLEQCKSMEEYIAKITDTALKLTEIGFAIADDMIGALMLSGLPKKYRPMIMALESSGIRVTGDAVKVKLLQEIEQPEDNIKVKEEAAFYSRAKVNGRTRKEIQRSYEKPELRECYTCGKVGHLAAKCRNKSAEHTRNKDGEKKQRDFASVEDKNWQESDEWLLDSGASSHMTGNKQQLKSLVQCNKTITAANCSEMHAMAIGTAEVEMTVSGNKERIKVENVLYVPGLAANFLSVEKIARKGYRVVITQHGCRIFDTEGALMATARAEGVYKLNLAHERTYMAKEAEKKGNLWHRRLGHIGNSGMKILASMSKDSSLDLKINLSNCDIWVQGKSARQPFPSSGKRAKKILEIVHSDVNGPMSCASIGGARYYVAFIDDHSRKKFVYFIKNKNEVFKAFREFKIYTEKQTEKKIKILRSDNGREYINNEFASFLRGEGIIHQKIVPYSPQQNGLAERANRSIVERARCLLADSKLPTRFWAEATATATYLINRSPASILKGRSPEEIWTKRKPKLNHLRIFGCTAWAHIPKEKRHKWDVKAKKMTFVGYDENVKGYRLIDRDTDEVTISRDVTFDESVRETIIYNKTTTFEHETDEDNKNDETEREIEESEDASDQRENIQPEYQQDEEGETSTSRRSQRIKKQSTSQIIYCIQLKSNIPIYPVRTKRRCQVPTGTNGREQLKKN